MNDETVKNNLGKSVIGLMGATQAGTTAVLSVPASWLATRYGHGCVLAICSVAYAAICIVYISCHDSAIGRVQYVACIFVAFGFCRISFEVNWWLLFISNFIFISVFFFSGSSNRLSIEPSTRHRALAWLDP